MCINEKRTGGCWVCCGAVFWPLSPTCCKLIPRSLHLLRTLLPGRLNPLGRIRGTSTAAVDHRIPGQEGVGPAEAEELVLGSL